MKKSFSIIFVTAFFILLIINADSAKIGASNGIMLACKTAIPSLFPFFVASSMLSMSGAVSMLSYKITPFMMKRYSLSGEVIGVFILGITGGYPVGVCASAELYEMGRISKKEAEKMLGFCNNTGPAFIIGVCGAGILGSVKLGAILYVIHILSALICAGFFVKSEKNTQTKMIKPPKIPPLSEVFVMSCERAAHTSIKVGAFIVLFCVISAVLEKAYILDFACSVLGNFLNTISLTDDIAKPIVLGCLELTQGLCALDNLPLYIILPVMSGMLAFGGFSVWFQSASIALKSGLNLSYCIKGKLAHTLVSIILTMPIGLMTNDAVSVMNTGVKMPMLSLQASVVLMVVILCIFTSGKMYKNTV